MDGSDGANVIMVKDIIPYVHIADGEKSSLIPIKKLTNLTYLLSAALFLSGEGNDTTMMVQVANVSLSDGNKILTLHANPLNYYEGELLKSFSEKRDMVPNTKDMRFDFAGLYLEPNRFVAQNGGNGGSGDYEYD